MIKIATAPDTLPEPVTDDSRRGRTTSSGVYDNLDDLRRDILLDRVAGYRPNTVTQLLELADVVFIDSVPRVIA